MLNSNINNSHFKFNILFYEVFQMKYADMKNIFRKRLNSEKQHCYLKKIQAKYKKNSIQRGKVSSQTAFLSGTSPNSSL